MSLTREDERQKNGCPSRGFGIAAAAIGVGVGAALYYFFNKRAEQPNSEGSTSDWNCERAQTLHHSSDEYTTISENETSDTSIHDYDVHLLCEKEETFIIEVDLNDNSDLATTISDSDEFTNSEDSVSSSSTENIINYSSDPYAHLDSSDISSTYYVEDSTSDLENSTASDSNDDSSSSSSSSNHTSDISETSEYDMTTSSLGIPEHTPERSRSPLQRLFPWAFCSNGRKRKRLTEEQQMAMIRQDQFRERSWTLEPCSICFDMMLRDQELMRLPCAHNFHTQCILPWLQEKQTCPVCREVAE